MVTERETQGGRCLTTPWSGVWQVVGPIAGVGGRAPEAGKDPRQRVRHNRLNDRSTASCPSGLGAFRDLLRAGQWCRLSDCLRVPRVGCSAVRTPPAYKLDPHAALDLASGGPGTPVMVSTAEIGTRQYLQDSRVGRRPMSLSTR